TRRPGARSRHGPRPTRQSRPRGYQRGCRDGEPPRSSPRRAAGAGAPAVAAWQGGGMTQTPRGLIAVTGATGGLGGRVAPRRAAAGVPQRLVVRDAARAPSLPGAEVATVTGLGDPGSMRAALTGAHTVFLVSATEDADRKTLHTAAVDAAVAADVSRVVYVSF